MKIVDLDLDFTHENARDFGLNNFYHALDSLDLCIDR